MILKSLKLLSIYNPFSTSIILVKSDVFMDWDQKHELLYVIALTNEKWVAAE